MASIGITGGAGYIGAKLAQRLIQEGHFVKIVDKQPLKDIDSPNLEIANGDVLDEKVLEQFVDGLDFVYHLAAIANARDCSNNIRKSIDLNVLSTRLLLEKVKHKNIKGFFFPSSIVALYGELEYIPADEKHPIKPINDYGVLKRASELFCLAYYRSFGVPVIIGRQSTVYGPSPSMKLDCAAHNFIHNVINGKDIVIYGSGNQKRNFIFIDDLVEAYFKIFTKSFQNQDILGEVFHLAGKEVITINALAQKIIKIGQGMLGAQSKIEHKQAQNEPMARDLKISITKVKEYFGFEPRYSIDDGLKETFSYLHTLNKESRRK